MLTTSTTPIKHTPTDQEQSQLTQLSDFFKQQLKTPNEIYINASGEVVYQAQDQKPIVGFSRIYHYARTKQLDIATALSQDILKIETRYKAKVKIISQMKLNLILKEYENKQPDMANVVKILSRELQPLFTVKKRDDKIKTYDPCVNITQYANDYHEIVPQTPDALQCFVDAVTHPKLGEVVFYLGLFAQLEIDERTAVKGLEAKDHETFVAALKHRFYQFAQSSTVVDEIFYQYKRLFRNSETQLEKLNKILELIKKLGKIAAENIELEVLYDGYPRERPLAGRYTLKAVCDTRFEEGRKFTFSDKMMIQEIQDAAAAQPDHVPIVVDDAGLKAVVAVTNKLKNAYVKLFDALLYRVEYKKLDLTEQEIIPQLLKLLGVLDAESLIRHTSYANPEASGSAKVSPFERVINIGNAELFKEMWIKCQGTKALTQELSDELVICIGKAKIADEARHAMLEILFVRGVALPLHAERRAEFWANIEKRPVKFLAAESYFGFFAKGCVSRVVGEMEAVNPYFNFYLADMIVSYVWPEESIKPARDVFRQRR